MTRSPRRLATRAAVVATLALCGCAVVHQFNEPYERTPAQLFSERWVGRSEDDVLMRYGKPTDTVALSSGNRVLSFVRSQPAPDLAAATTPPDGTPRAPAGTAWCERRFEIDKEKGRVVRTEITGNSCNYEL